mmetsp:Transcript_72635/g.201397  ORF Transcript_72635/g.201397 Transcript_72635/m.201397 type:complete len:611 (-) Transcript_72635:119-1951(-)|eukprot:CAMPEP_0176285360 /NCGR_PEP_ID=MMETSP0121_2-20121125/52326_1 /TAXON_ID=160619 /ORGANISM="Kryptoperidinium foliaceum, Strain CCMP 1326" /LENGTH=610 /DNA_ID=CAMNT_0017625835 /DNA_START=169 /DNA_END=2004 /DNA_ORIENTATION=+
MSGSNAGTNTPTNEGFSLVRPFGSDRSRTPTGGHGDASSPSVVRMEDVSPSSSRGRTQSRDGTNEPSTPVRCINPASDINSRLDTQVEVRVYPCNNSQGGSKKKFTTFTIKPEGVIIQGSNRSRNTNTIDLGAEYASHIGRKLQRYELSDTRACQLLVTTHAKNFWVVPAPEAFSRHSGTCRLLGDRKHPPAPHTLQVGDFLRVGSVGVVVIETHDGVENRVLSEEKIQKIMKDTTNSNGGFLDLQETDGENSEDSLEGETRAETAKRSEALAGDNPVCYMCFDEEDTELNPLITPCKCSGDTKYVHVDCLRKWHTAEADNQICFLSSVDATCSVCKSTFKSDFKLRDGRHVKLFKSSLEPPYVSLLVATKHEMAQRLFNTRFQLSFSTLLKPDGRNGTRPLLLGRSSGSDMVLDYRTVSARHAAIRFKNGEFIFTDAGSSNGSYLYLRRPLELSPSQSVQFRLGRSMISMKVVNKWNRRLLRAVRRTGQGSSVTDDGEGDADDRSIGSNDDDVRVTDGSTGVVTKSISRRTRESVMETLPPPGQLSQQSVKHLDLLYALAYPKRDLKDGSQSRSSSKPRMKIVEEAAEGEVKVDDDVAEVEPEAVLTDA